MLAFLRIGARRTTVPVTDIQALLSCSSRRSLAGQADGAAPQDERALRAAREWLSSFKLESIPRNECIVTYSRSSGPGGQNVNKVNSKATLRLPCPLLFSVIPELLQTRVRESRFYAAKSHSVIVQSDGSRSQRDNVEECVRKLYDMIVEVGRAAIPGVTSQGQKKRVEELYVDPENNLERPSC
ncbi:MAG: hypothetical protein M1815_005381 [Lichina confinis]|nr:MAG: hypothetical protein M1815_005381 [Lichina confinis]